MSWFFNWIYIYCLYLNLLDELVFDNRYWIFDNFRYIVICLYKYRWYFFAHCIFSNVLRYPLYQVIIGQYVGMGLLVTISIIFSLVSLVIPSFLIGLMGFVPIVIGIKKLIEKHNKEKNSFKNKNQNKSTSLLSFVSVAAVCFKRWRQFRNLYTNICSLQFHRPAYHFHCYIYDYDSAMV